MKGFYDDMESHANQSVGLRLILIHEDRTT